MNLIRKTIMAIVAVVGLMQISGSAAAAEPAAQATSPEHPVVLNVLYNAPRDPAAFETYYAAKHLPLVAKIKGLDHTVLIKGWPNADGSKPAFYRIAQLFFASPAQLAQAMSSPEGQAAVTDLKNFADGGVTVVVGEVR